MVWDRSLRASSTLVPLHRLVARQDNDPPHAVPGKVGLRACMGRPTSSTNTVMRSVLSGAIKRRACLYNNSMDKRPLGRNGPDVFPQTVMSGMS